MNFFSVRFPGYGYVCAHRGARSIAPENTLLAAEKARQCGADLWETDIHIAADGEAVLFHDETLTRTTDVETHERFGSRAPFRLGDFRLAELEELSAGCRFLQQDPFGTIASGELHQADLNEIEIQKIPTLHDALDFCRRHDFPVNLELKDQGGSAADRIIVPAVLDLVGQTGTADLVLVSSFNHDYLRRIKGLNPAIATAALVEERHPDDLLDYLRELQVAAYHPDWRITDEHLIRSLNRAGIRVNLWTVNEMEQARFFIAAGTTFICTDWPQRLLSGHRSA